MEQPLHRECVRLQELGELLQELQEGAALEASVYMVRVSTAHGKGSKACKPARRLMRTLARMGPQEGQRLLQSALKAVEAQVSACGADVSSAAFWWLNVVVLRQHLSSIKSPEWKRLVESLKGIEVATFQHVLSTLWEGLILPAVAVPLPVDNVGAALGQHSRTSSVSSAFGLLISQPSGGVPGGSVSRQREAALRGGEEVAVQRWLDLLDHSHKALAAARCNDVITLLEDQVMKQVLGRIDRMVHSSLLRGGSNAGGSGSGGRGGGSQRQGAETPDSDDAVRLLSEPFMPFKPGLVSFGVGMHLKMAATRLTQWAIETGHAEENTDPALLFPLTISCAAILLLPKEQLADPSTRKKVSPALHMREIISLLNRFEPDDFCSTVIEPGLMNILESQVRMARQGSGDMLPGSDRGGTFLDDSLMEEDYVELLRIGKEAAKALLSSGVVSTAMDADSDEELTDLEALEKQAHHGQQQQQAAGGSADLARFELLRQLWCQE